MTCMYLDMTNVTFYMTIFLLFSVLLLTSTHKQLMDHESFPDMRVWYILVYNKSYNNDFAFMQQESGDDLNSNIDSIKNSTIS